MSAEDFEGQDPGYVPENPHFPQIQADVHDAGNVLDDSGFPQQHSGEHFDGYDAGNVAEVSNPPENHFDGYDAGNVAEDPNPPENHFDGYDADNVAEDHVVAHDAGDLPQNLNSAQEHNDVDVPENFGSRKQQSEIDSKGNEIKKWPGWPGENVFRMLVPVQKVGSIIGRKGEFIKKITEETKARIKILDGPPGTSERAVMVSAKEEPDRQIPPAVEGLLRVHRQIANVDADSTSTAGRPVLTRLLVADTQAGSLIGKQGSTIKSIQDASGCTIRVLGAEHLPVFALRDDSIVEIQGEAAGVYKAVELIASHLRKFLVDRSIVGVFERKMQAPDVRVNQNVPPPHQAWGPPPQGFPAPAGGGPGFAPNDQYMPPSHHYDNYYPPAELPPVDKPFHQGPPAFGRDAPIGMHSGSAQPQHSVVTKVTQHMQIPLSFADAVIGTSGANISYIRRASGASITIQETRGVPGEMTVEISGTASQIQTAQQLVQNFMAEAAGSTQDHMGGSINQGYNAYPANNAPVYSSAPSGAGSHAGSAPADYGTVYGSNYGY